MVLQRKCVIEQLKYSYACTFIFAHNNRLGL